MTEISRWGCIDKTGKVVIEIKYDDSVDFEENDDGIIEAYIQGETIILGIDGKIEIKQTKQSCHANCGLDEESGNYCEECMKWFCYNCIDDYPSGYYCEKCAESRGEND